MKLKNKFFMLFAFNAFLILLLMAIVLYLFLYRNFWEYVNIVELNKLDSLVSALEEIYEINNNLNLLRNNPKKWHETIFLVLIQGRPKGSHITNLIKIITEKNYILKSEHLPKDGNIIFLPEDPMKLGDRLFLLDKEKNYICGNKQNESKNTLRKIKYHQINLKKDVIRLSKLIEDLHMLSKADSQNLYMQKEDLNPNEPLIESLDSFQTHLESNDITPKVHLRKNRKISSPFTYVPARCRGEPCVRPRTNNDFVTMYDGRTQGSPHSRQVKANRTSPTSRIPPLRGVRGCSYEAETRTPP